MKKRIHLRGLLFLLAVFCFTINLMGQGTAVKTNVKAKDISIGGDGSVWIAGVDNGAYKWESSQFKKKAADAVRIAVGPEGEVWIVSANGEVKNFSKEDNQWNVIGDVSAKDIAAGADGSVYVVSTKKAAGGYEIYQLDENWEWQETSYVAVRIAIDANGVVYMIDNQKKLFGYDENDERIEYTDGVIDLAIAGDDIVWVCTSEGEVLRMGDEWETKAGKGTAVAIENEKNYWVVAANGTISKLGLPIRNQESDGDAEETKEPEEKPAPKTNPQTSAVKTNIEEESTLGTRQGTPLAFQNVGTNEIEIYESSNTEIGRKVTSIRKESTVQIPVNIGDQFEVKINGKFNEHHKIYITNTKNRIYLIGNVPLKDVAGYLAGTYEIPDYEPNLVGVDMTIYNPRNLVKTMDRKRVFERLDPTAGTDYVLQGKKLTKFGFDLAGTNLAQGSNNSTMSYGYSAFSKSWSLNVGGSGAIPVKGVSINPAMDFGYSEDEMEDRSSESTYVYSREQKSNYMVTVNPLKAYLDVEFKEAVRNVTDMQSAEEFVESYGTHYPKVVYYGGDRSAYAIFTKEQYSKAKSFGIDLKAKVGVSKMGVKSEKFGGNGKQTGHTKESGEVGEGHAAFSYKQGSEEESVFENSQLTYRMVGGEGGFDSWSVSDDNAAPIAAEFDIIYNLIMPDIFKDDSDPAQLSMAKQFIKAAVDIKLKNMPKLKTPLPPPNIYSIYIEKMEVTAEIDDLNKNTKGNVTANVYIMKNSQRVPIGSSINLWSKPNYDIETLKFVKGTTYFPPMPSAKITQFADSLTANFPTLFVEVNGEIFEKDEFRDQLLAGKSGQINLSALNLAPGQTSSQQSFEVVNDILAHEGKIRITYRVRREPSEFDDKLF